MSWLLAYDVACPRRWRAVHGLASDHGHRLQYSLWWLPLSRLEMDRLWRDLAKCIDPAADDVRAYPFPNDAWCRLWGAPPWGDGVVDRFSMRFSASWRDRP
ncbi:CRISPR-associated endonuclease Cas2 [Oceanicella actignis]|uniref:CRISPR-associated endoribonuclease Cas2 n=1 Tax=Oceanicella actignis TaxID=1189325 RepID=A0A1M7S1H4_9RHOB|nr:CRISPR-associated endonuclease Cas2 [Oceanicella actignis]SES91104.1 CRISPR associated protein Cas2 [Oceanicella actignis]SHN52479.1 CRISPR-associated endonuclease Cas2 [Oceanicella actignis]